VSHGPIRILQCPLCKILGFLGGGCEENCLLGHDVILSGR
jgi:hypothetical protein